jgi:sarcosine oxidase, subunit gamma
MNAENPNRRSFVYRRLAVHPRPRATTDFLLSDLSLIGRWGLKGRDALPWLQEAGAAIPLTDNAAITQSDGSLVARLSPSEALILAPLNSDSAIGRRIDSLPVGGSGACYPAPRNDSHCWFVVTGPRCADMFAKLCAVDMAPEKFANGQIAQTSVARLSAIVIRHDRGDLPGFSILADSASAEYLWDCLQDAMAEFAGSVCSARDLESSQARESVNDNSARD